MKKKMKVWTIIPAYNEAKHISEVIKGVKAQCKNIVVVDDGSIDETFKLSKKQNIHVLKHILNMGKGVAVKTGCDFAIKQGAEIIILIDADGQNDPNEIPQFLKAIKEHDIVFGVRRFNKNMPFIKRWGNTFINKVTRLLYNLDLQDTQSGYRAFTAKAFEKIKWEASDYSMESEMIANVGRHKLKYTEIPIKTIYSDKYKGTTVLDGIKIVFNMILWKWRT